MSADVPRCNGGSPGDIAGPSKTRRDTVHAACGACRLKKTKCDAIRPICSACRKQRMNCEYPVQEHETRSQASVRRLQEAEEVVADLTEFLDLLRRSSIESATGFLMALQSLPVGSVDIVEFVRQIMSSLSGNRSPSSSPSPRSHMPLRTPNGNQAQPTVLPSITGMLHGQLPSSNSSTSPPSIHFTAALASRPAMQSYPSSYSSSVPSRPSYASFTRRQYSQDYSK